jgi:A/G-specific adenine glycosylase
VFDYPAGRTAAPIGFGFKAAAAAGKKAGVMRVTKFQKTVWDFYASHKRKFPWRQTKSAYRILVSEMMLQQTQVSRVVPKYKLFLKLFPSWRALASARTSEILSAWQGLGYNRRALYLKRCAEAVVKHYNGALPKTLDELVQLPGIGENTAGAILAYAYNTPSVFIETNIRRVFIHHFFHDKKNVGDNELLPIVARALDRKNPREWYWALMDYGSFLSSTVENPNRRSKHYNKQSKFQGSFRQLRGKILQLLMQGPMPINQILIKSARSKQDVERAVAVLIKEGFLKKIKGNIKLM